MKTRKGMFSDLSRTSIREMVKEYEKRVRKNKKE
jgi:hypothetical protein